MSKPGENLERSRNQGRQIQRLAKWIRGRHLNHTYAESIPTLDFHSHLPPAQIADNARFETLTDIWLEGDHYKWRAMRANGFAGKFCSGDATAYEKFEAWAKTVPRALRNPLYHWTHLELRRYFGIHDLLDESSAAEIWAKANKVPADDQFGTLK